MAQAAWRRRTEPSDTVVRAALELRALAWIVTKLAQRDLVRRLEASGVDLGGRALSLGVLRLLRRRACTSSELSREMMLTPATLVPVVDALERRGFVTRGRDPADRRRAPLTLTRRGSDVLARVRVIGAGDALVRGMRGFSDAERRELIRLLRALARRMAGAEGQIEILLSHAVAGSWRRARTGGRRGARGAQTVEEHR